MVERVTDLEFDSMWNDGPELKDDPSEITVTLYYTDRCPHSLRLIPIWNNFKERVPLIKTNELCDQIPSDIKIVGYPTIVLRIKGEAKVLQGYTDLESILNFVALNQDFLDKGLQCKIDK